MNGQFASWVILVPFSKPWITYELVAILADGFTLTRWIVQTNKKTRSLPLIPSVSDPLGVPFQGPTVPYGVGSSSPPFFLNQLPLHCTFCFPPSPLSLRATAELSRVFRLVPRGPVCGLRLDSVGVGDLERTGPKRFRLLRVRSARITHLRVTDTFTEIGCSLGALPRSSGA